MEERVMTSEEAQLLLRYLCDHYGGVGKVADMAGVSISAVSHQLHGRQAINGKVAKFMGIRLKRTVQIGYVKEDD